MKKFLFLILTLPCLVFSQQYMPLSDEGNIWSVSHLKLFAIGDTVLGGKTYKKIYYKELDSTFNAINLLYVCGIRDSTDGRTYFRPRLETTEQILYDWNLNIGDSILLHSYCCNPSYSSFSSFNNFNTDKDVITSVDSVMIDGTYRKRMEVPAYVVTISSFYWVEGIGSLQGLFNNSFANIGTEEGPPNLVCFHHYDTLVYHNYMGGDTSNIEDACYYFHTLGINENVNSKIIIFPNPVHDFLYIQTSSTQLENYHILSFDGKLVATYSGNVPIHIGQLSSGLYFICNENRIWFRKFIKN